MPTIPHTASRNRALCTQWPQEDVVPHSHTGSSGKCQGTLRAQQHTQPSHLVLLPELVQNVAVNGILHKADVKALYAEVEVPKPEDEAVGGRAVGYQGQGHQNQTAEQGRNQPSLRAALASSAGTLRSTRVGRHSAESLASCQPCRNSSGVDQAPLNKGA